MSLTITPELLELNAGEWRSRGLDVPANVPDCAGIECDGFAPGDVVRVGTRIVIQVDIVRPRWSWVTVTGRFEVPAEPLPQKGPPQ